MECRVLEIVEFKAAPGVSSNSVDDAAAAMGPWLQAQPGFVWRRLVRFEDGELVDCIEWRDLASAKAAAAAIMTVPGAAAFMATIDPATVRMRHAEVRIAQ